jgi:hypothetical protein
MKDEALIALYKDAWQARLDKARAFFEDEMKFPAESSENLAYHAATMWLRDTLYPDKPIGNSDNISPMATRKFIEADKDSWQPRYDKAYSFFANDMQCSPRVATEMATRTANHHLQQKMLESGAAPVGRFTKALFSAAVTPKRTTAERFSSSALLFSSPHHRTSPASVGPSAHYSARCDSYRPR